MGVDLAQLARYSNRLPGKKDAYCCQAQIGPIQGARRKLTGARLYQVVQLVRAPHDNADIRDHSLVEA